MFFDYSHLLTLCMTYFVIANPIGNAPAILTLVKDFPLKRQKIILFRETMLSLLLAIFFQYVGQHFLSLLHLQHYALALSGGILLLIIGLNLIFPDHSPTGSIAAKKEPFLVPIATPLITGPGLLAIIMLNAKEAPNQLVITVALILTWIGVGAVLMMTPYLQALFGKRGITALEQLMGLIVSMISIDMIVNGITLFINSLNQAT